MQGRYPGLLMRSKRKRYWTGQRRPLNGWSLWEKPNLHKIIYTPNKIIKEYISDVNKHVKIDRAFLFGSYAKGNYSHHSDLDIAIFSDSFKGQSFVDAVSFLFSLARKYKDVCIEPVAFTASEIREDNPFVKEIISTGKEIPLNWCTIDTYHYFDHIL